MVAKSELAFFRNYDILEKVRFKMIGIIEL
ncbi:Protein of unknown function [Bacillus thuringiensis]|uniref:Uncharacterized protein n=1 Tax=Bacillus thuringiensis TaxID=1428 RepID=A0A1C4BNW4_BACTU|nr:Protein of unknown function [Bacillus mobilis]SCC08565.1 Protein of unknown function [Bacillus thuringiensis]SCL88251.1 Protein of unknown function [Bacillus wiedmannii]